MLSLPHASVGMAIATLIPNPLITLPLALTSHFIFDYFPHWNPGSRQFLLPKSQLLIFSDLTLTLVFCTYVSLLRQSPIFILAGLAAIFPDLIEGPHFFLNFNLPGVKKLMKYQGSHQFHISPLPGLATQLLLLLICFTIIFR